MTDPEQIATLHLGSAMTDGGHRAAAFASAIVTAERLGYRVTLREWRDGSDTIYGVIAEATKPDARSSQETR